jgi:hypothetical protein
VFEEVLSFIRLRHGIAGRTHRNDVSEFISFRYEENNSISH